MTCQEIRRTTSIEKLSFHTNGWIHHDSKRLSNYKLCCDYAFKRNNSITPTRFGRLSNHQHRYAASVSVSHRDSTQDCPNLLLQNDLARQRPNDSFHNSHASTLARRVSLRTLACFMHTELQSFWINHFDASTAHKNAHQLQSAHRHQTRSDALPHNDVEAFRIRGTASSEVLNNASKRC